MMMKLCWDLSTQGRWFRRTTRILTVLLFCALPVCAETLESLAGAYRKRATSANKNALLRFAAAHQDETGGALALLVVGATEAQGSGYKDAIPRLQEAQQRLPELKDYVAYYLARALSEAEEFSQAIHQLETPINGSPASPLRNRAVLLAARVYVDAGKPEEAVGLLREYLAEVPQPEGLSLLASSLEAAKDYTAAAATYQRVYYEYPRSTEAKTAATAMNRLKRRLRSAYPPVMPEAMFKRVDRLIKARQHVTARRELQLMIPKLGGADRDRARVWLGKARYVRRHDSVAYQWLNSLKVSDPDADAERLYYLLASARRLRRTGSVTAALNQLNQKHPNSPWRLEALVSAGNQYLLVNQSEKYEPIYRACASSFPTAPRAAYCHWKVVWSRYLKQRSGAAGLLREHIQLFPASEKTTAALYFLGRLSEDAGDPGAARTYYEEISAEYPNYYYAALARERLREVGPSAGGDSDAVRDFLAGIEFPRRNHRKNFEPDEATELRLRRGRLLSSAGLTDWAERELRFGARTDAQAPVLAMELARAASSQGQYGKSIRYIKGLAPGYLSISLDSAPASFWHLAYPLHYRDLVEKYSSRRDLDLYFLAALIRQESEFDRRAVSRARAYGLTQILPATGRQLYRKTGYRSFRTSMLYQPEVNINMGTYYLRALIDDLEGHTHAALASYNAGKTRAKAWLTWADYREPAEFVETVPFTETRNYIETVLRNADIYRRIYSGTAADR